MALRLATMNACDHLVPAPPASSAGLRVVEVNDASQLGELRLVWDSLLAQTAGANYFQTLDWLQVFWKHVPSSDRLRVLVVYSQGRPIGILPLCVRWERSKVGPIRVLNYPLADWGSFYGPIGPNPTATLLAGLGHLQRTRRDWDTFDLRYVNELADGGRTWRTMQVQGFQAYRNRWADVALVRLADFASWDAYWASRSSKWRNNVRRNERNLKSLGTLRHVRYRPAGASQADDDPRWDLYDQCEQVARASWQADANDGTTITHDRVRPLLREQHAAAVRAGGVDLNLLYVADRPVAFNYCYHYRGHLFGLRMGFDRTADGAGSVLMARMLEESFSRGDHTHDLGTDYLDCKRPWHTHQQSSQRYSHYPTNLSRAQLLRAKRWLETLRGTPS